MKMPFILASMLAWGVPLHAATTDPLNVLLICVDDFRPELHCYGVDYIRSPHIDRLAASGRLFLQHYVQAPTCGASRCALLTGRYGGAGNAALFERARRMAAHPGSVPPSLPAWFRRHGYTTVSVGKVSHHPGGRGGPDWNDENILEMPESWDRHLLDPGPWKHPRGWMHGLANGEIRVVPKEMDVMQSVEGPDDIYPDGINTRLALKQLEELAGGEKPFFLAFGILRPHLPFGAPARYMLPYRDADLPPIPHPTKPAGRPTWHRSGEFFQYNTWGRNPNTDPAFATAVRKHYAACVSFADAQVGRILRRLQELGLTDRTIVVLWGDHGWHLGEHAIWGKHSLFEESLRAPLIIRYPGIPQPGQPTSAMVETIDLFPTLTDLAGLPVPDFVHGVSLRPMLENPTAAGHPAFSYKADARTIRTPTHRLIQHKDGYLELYDHRTDAGETRNVADTQPQAARQLVEVLQQRFTTYPPDSP